MPGAVRFGDYCSGHGCWPPRPNDQASQDVFVNGRGSHRLGDHWQSHCCSGSCHDAFAAQGSPDVFVNGKSMCRIGDMVSCGSTMEEGSADVFVNG